MRRRQRMLALGLASLFSFLPNHLMGEEDDRLLLSPPEHVIGLNPQPNVLIDGMIHPLSGSICLSQTDLVAQGAQPISLTRYFTSPVLPVKYDTESFYDKVASYQQSPTLGGWSFLGHLVLSYCGGNEVRVAEPNGLTLAFSTSWKGGTSLNGDAKGLHNVGSDGPTGRADIRNTSVKILDDGNRVVVRSPEGIQREYHMPNQTPAGSRRLLYREVFPNGKSLRYHYDDDDILIEITSHDLQEKFTYARLTQETHPDRYLFSSHTGSKATYFLEVRQDQYEETIRKHRTTRTHNALRTAKPLLVGVESPAYLDEKLAYSDRFLLDTFQGKDRSYRYHYFPRTVRVNWKDTVQWGLESIEAPIGQGGSYQTAYSLEYDVPRRDYCDSANCILYPDGACDAYDRSREGLVNGIAHYGSDKRLYCEERFNWTEDRFRGGVGRKNWLASQLIQDGHQNILSKREYSYDPLGNPIEETFSGNLTGKADKETLTVRRQFSTDGNHLLLEESHENGLTKRYTYLPGMQLVTSELICEGDKPLQRTFWEYDDCYNLVREITDDGYGRDSQDDRGVCERRFKDYKLRQEPPFLHMQEWIEDSYWADGAKHTLRKIHLQYDQWGNICQEDVYDASNELAFTIFKAFDEQGNLLSETNPLGEKATYTYDSHGRLLTSVDFAQTTTTYTYDAAGRLVEKKIRGFDGLEKGTSYAYDLRSRCISETNHLGHKTHYTHDPVSQKVTKTRGPPISGLNGHQDVITSCDLDPFGREVAFTDARGHTTRRSFNAYGDPTRIEHPDGGVETFYYDKERQLISHTDPQGLEVRYVRDILGRIILKTWHSPTGKELARETFTYRGNRLVEETNKEGRVTRYEYDGAGLKVKEESCGQIICFGYDSLGRLEWTEGLNGAQTLITTYKRDLLGQVIEEFTQDKAGKLLTKISHTYDAQRNIASTTHWVAPDKGFTEYWEYDSLNRLTAHTDQLGHTTKIFHSEDHHDLTTGLQTRRAVTIYPSGRQLEEIFDPYDRVIATKERDISGSILSAKDLVYDPNGNLLERRDHIYQGANLLKTTRYLWKYDSRDRKIEQIEAGLSPDEQITHYSYFLGGFLQSKQLPGGVVLNYAYDGLGYLTSLVSTGSDHNISYAYTKNRLGQLVRVVDQYAGKVTYRLLDPFGNILEEGLANDLTVSKTYDAFNRPISVVYPDKSRVTYEYDSAFLREIKRYDSGGRLQYTHSYSRYDLRGQLEEEVMMGTLGKIFHSHDEKGRLTATHSDHFTQSIKEYDLEGNPLRIEEEDKELNLSYDPLSQLATEKSIAGVHSYAYDSNYNRLARDGNEETSNDLNQLIQAGDFTCRYDLAGRLIEQIGPESTTFYTYDALDRLVAVKKGDIETHFTYDPFGRRLSKHVHNPNAWVWKDWEEKYFYDQERDLGALDRTGYVTHARVLGHKQEATSIEIGGKAYMPFHDLQGNVRALVDPKTGTSRANYHYSSFGEDLSPDSAIDNPWRYVAKRWDCETGLILFGKRYYDPQMGRWLTRDPAGFTQSTNSYQFCFNNPWRYTDPNGEFVFLLAIPIVYAGSWVTAAVIADAAIGAAVLAGAGWACQQADRAFNHRPSTPSYGSEPVFVGGTLFGGAISTQSSLEKLFASSYLKDTEGVYTPDRLLPRDEKSGEPKPDTDAPHTQLGQREGGKGPYRQTREWGEDGREIKRTDWTDHGRPSNHPCPHDHVCKPNPTGGTPSRGNPEPFKVFRGT